MRLRRRRGNSGLGVLVFLLKESYNRLLHMCNVLEESADEVETEELERTRTHCIKVFLLF